MFLGLRPALKSCFRRVTSMELSRRKRKSIKNLKKAKEFSLRVFFLQFVHLDKSFQLRWTVKRPNLQSMMRMRGNDDDLPLGHFALSDGSEVD